MSDKAGGSHIDRIVAHDVAGLYDVKNPACALVVFAARGRGGTEEGLAAVGHGTSGDMRAMFRMLVTWFVHNGVDELTLALEFHDVILNPSRSVEEGIPE